MAAPQKPQWQRKKDAHLEYLVWRNGALGANKGDSQGSQALIGKDKDVRGPLTPNRIFTPEDSHWSASPTASSRALQPLSVPHSSLGVTARGQGPGLRKPLAPQNTPNFQCGMQAQRERN